MITTITFGAAPRGTATAARQPATLCCPCNGGSEGRISLGQACRAKAAAWVPPPTTSEGRQVPLARYLSGAFARQVMLARRLHGPGQGTYRPPLVVGSALHCWGLCCGCGRVGQFIVTHARGATPRRSMVCKTETNTVWRAMVIIARFIPGSWLHTYSPARVRGWGGQGRQ